MAMTKLLVSHRAFLNTLAKEQVKCPAEEAADKAAYAKAAPIVRKIVEVKYPLKDMKLLEKYEVAQGDNCIRLQLAAGGVEEFCFNHNDTFPLRPTGYDCGRNIYLADEAATVLITASLTASAAFKKAMETKLTDYRALVECSTSLEQVEEAWPAASALRPRIARTLPVLLSDEVIARIKADTAKMKRAA